MLKIIEKDNHFFSRVHVEDIAKVLTLSFKKFISGEIYNISDDYPCSNDEIVQLYNNKIFGVDSSIKKGEYGEILFIENNQFFRGTLSGNKIQL